MALTSIGTVTLTQYEPSLSWTSEPTRHGIRRCTISGRCDWTDADELSELVANPARQQTIGGFTGVLEFVTFSDSLLSPKTGYYLLESFEQSASHEHSVGTAPVPFSISAAYLGDLA